MPLCCNVILLFVWLAECERVLPSSRCPGLAAASRPQGRGSWEGVQGRGAAGCLQRDEEARPWCCGTFGLWSFSQGERKINKQTGPLPGSPGSDAERFLLHVVAAQEFVQLK